MALKDLKTINVKDADLERIQDNIAKWVGQLNTTFLGGVVLQSMTNANGASVDITLGATTIGVPHGLGRKFSGWVLIDKTSSANVWRDTTSTADPEKFIPLQASGAVTVKLWVF